MTFTYVWVCISEYLKKCLEQCSFVCAVFLSFFFSSLELCSSVICNLGYSVVFHHYRYGFFFPSSQYLASLGIQSLVQQRAFAGKAANKLMDALKDSDLLHWKHSLSELIDISIAQKTAIWRLYGRRYCLCLELLD